MPTSPHLLHNLRQFLDVAMHRSMRERAQLARATGISMPQFGVLIQLRYRGNCSITDISERFEVTAPAASQLVDKLVQSGLVERAEDPADRRAKQITLTARGKAILEKGMNERYRWLGPLVASLSAKDGEKIADALAVLTQAAEKLEVTE